MTVQEASNEDRLDRIGRLLEESISAHDKEMADIREIVQSNTAAIAALGKRVDQLTGQQQRTNQEMSTIKGWQTELTVERKADDVFARLSSNGDLFRIHPRPDLKHYIGYGTRAGFVSRAEAAQIQAVDFLMEGSDGDGSPIMFAVEVSYAAGDSDIQRAVERAPLAAKLLGRQVLPAVAAEVITTDFEEKAERSGIRWTYVPNGNSLMQ